MKKISIISAATLLGWSTLLAGHAHAQERELASAVEAIAEQPVKPDVLGVDAQGALHFTSPQAFFTTLDALATMTPAQQDAWEDSIGFVSQRREFARAMEEVEQAKTAQDQEQLLRAHADVVNVVEDEATPRIAAQGYLSVINRQGIFFVDGVVHMVLPDVVITSEDGNVETIQHALATPVEAGKALPVEGVRMERYDGSDVLERGVSAGCTDYRSAFYNTSDRKIDFSIRTYRYFCQGCCGNYYYRVRAEWTLKGYKKNWLGRWVSYNTSYTHQNVAFEMLAPKVTGFNGVSSIFGYQTWSLAFASGTAGDYTSWTLATWVGNQVQNAVIAAPYFNRVKGQGKSRGTGVNGWANICCGYTYGCGF